MNEKVIKDLIEKNYDLEVKSSTKIKNTYKISADEEYCFKVVKYNFPHFYFILSAIVHLKNRGFSNVLDIIKDKKEPKQSYKENEYNIYYKINDIRN